VYPREQAGDKCGILREKFTVEDIPGFVLTELVRDIPLCDKIERETGLDIPRDLATVAGCDPSGQTPEGDSATKEVLDESDRREDEDEDDLHDRIEEVEKELEKQPDNISPSKPIEKPVTPAPETPDRDDSSDSGDSGSTPTPTPPDPTPDPDPDPDPDPGPEPDPDHDPDPTPPEPVTYPVVFNANGGIWGTNIGAIISRMDETGKVLDWPEVPVLAGQVFTGWYTAADGGDSVSSGKVFDAETELFAHWADWYFDQGTKTLTIAKKSVPGISGAEWNEYQSTVENVVLLEGVTGIGGYAFQSCSSLASVTIPSTVTTIESSAFIYCASLASVDIPEGVTTIKGSAFSNCGLTSVTIPGSVTSLEDYAFYYCQNLQTIRFGGTAAEWTALTSGKTDVIPDRATVYDKDNNPIP